MRIVPAPPASRGSPGAALPTLALICAAGLVGRVVMAWAFPTVAHPDEIFQILEQANRIASGRGLIPWEFADGARSWFVPGLFVPVFWLGRWLGAAPEVTLGAVTVLTALASLVPVICAYIIVARHHDRRAGLAAAAAVALWSDMVFLTAHPVIDTIALVPFAMLLAIGYRAEPLGRGALCWCGVLIAVVFVVRPQLAPALAVAGLVFARARPRAIAIMAAAGLPVILLILGLLDWLTWGAPFYSIALYFKTNLGGVSRQFGEAGPLFLVGEIRRWSWGFPLLLALAVLGARRMRFVVMLMIAVAVPFSLIGHKELRFFLPAIYLFLMLAGVGATVVQDEIAARLPRWKTLIGVAILLCWIAADVTAFRQPTVRTARGEYDGAVAILPVVNADPHICGVALDPAKWWATGYVRLRGDLHYYTLPATRLAGEPHRFNAVIALPESTRLAELRAAGFQRGACRGEFYRVCLYTRPTGCAGHGDRLLQADNPYVDPILARMRVRPFLGRLAP
jgi:phosphatidylinositol glycan class B